MTLDEEKRLLSNRKKKGGVRLILAQPEGTDDDALRALAERLFESIKGKQKKKGDNED